MNNRRLIQPSKAIVELWAHYLAVDNRHGVADQLMHHRASSLSDVAIKAQLLLVRKPGGFADRDVERLCTDIQDLCRRHLAAERRRVTTASVA